MRPRRRSSSACEPVGGLAGHRLLVRKRDAPHLLPAFQRQVVEVFGEPRHEVRLGHHHIDGQLHAQLAIQLGQTASRRVDVRLQAGGSLHQILRADREQDAVQRAPAAVLPQQRQELEPAGAVGRRVRVLGEIAARGVEEDRLVGEPPVAVARAADALQRIAAGFLFERKVQAGVDERRRLSRTGCADDRVPRQVVEAVPAAPLRLERADGFLEPLPQRDGVGTRLLLGGGLHHGRHQLVARADRLQLLPQDRPDVGEHDQQDDDQPGDPRLERVVVEEGEEGPGHPDEQCQEDQAENRQRFAEPRHHAPPSCTISTRRLRARFSGVDAGV